MRRVGALVGPAPFGAALVVIAFVAIASGVTAARMIAAGPAGPAVSAVGRGAGAPAEQRAAGPGSPQASQSAATGAVSGVVTDATSGQPIAGVNVQLGPPPQPGTSRLGNMFTDERGRFVFTGIAAGTYFINAIKSGYADGHYGPGVNGALGGSIVLETGEWFSAANIAVVKLGALGGRVTDETGQPVVGAFVRVLTEAVVGGATHLVAGPAATTDDLGEYRIAGLRAGRYVVVVPSVQHSLPAATSVADIEGISADRLDQRDVQQSRLGNPLTRRSGGELVDGSTALIVGNYVTPPPPVNGHAQAYPIAFSGGAATVSAAPRIELAVGADRSGIDVAIAPVAAVRVSGHLQSASANYTGIVLRLVPSGLEELGEGSEAATTLARPDGTFTFLNVPAGSYTLSAPGSSMELAVRPAAVGLRSHPLPATPGLSAGGGGVSGGLLSSPSGIAFNTHVPAAADPHAGFVRMPLVVGASDIRDLVVPVEPTSSIQGQITFEDVTGQVPGGAVELTPANGSTLVGAPTTNTGVGPSRTAFQFPLVMPGDYAIRFNMGTVTIKTVLVGGEDRTRGPITIPPGEDVTMAVTLTGKIIKVSGVVRDAKGAAVPQASVIAFPVDQQLWTGGGFESTWVRPSVGTSNGSYQVTNIRAGDYHLVGVDASHVSSWTDPAFLASAVPFAVNVSLTWGDVKTVDVPLMVAKR